jgi:hypothetical protein
LDCLRGNLKLVGAADDLTGIADGDEFAPVL